MGCWRQKSPEQIQKNRCKEPGVLTAQRLGHQRIKQADNYTAHNAQNDAFPGYSQVSRKLAVRSASNMIATQSVMSLCDTHEA